MLTVEYDPYGTEMDKKFGLPNNLLSVYRRPLNACNLAFLNRDETLTGPVPAPANEDKLDIMWDAREPSLQSQFTDATEFHGQINVAPPLAAIKQGVVFQSGMFAAQSYDNIAGDLTGASGDGALGGPMNLYNFQKSFCSASGIFGELICGPDFIPAGPPTTNLYSVFATSKNPMTNAMRESIARGEALFNTKTFAIFDVPGLNDLGIPAFLTNAASCRFCHNNGNVVNDGAFDAKRVGIMDNSNLTKDSAVVTVMPITPDYPVFAFYCPTDSITFFSNTKAWPACQMLPGHPMTCDKFVTTDPGKGLISGLCKDLGRMKVPILRGVGARAPYFHIENLITSFLSGHLNFHENTKELHLAHKAHSFPAKFHPQLPRKFILELTDIGDVVLDPMMGSGTTLLKSYLK